MKRERDAFRAIADPTRREIIGLLAEGPHTMNGLAEAFPGISRPAVSKHVKVLRECGLVRVRAEGRERICHADLEALREVYEWVARYEQFWNRKLDALGRFLDRGE